jgi:hypothetical protein
MYRLKLLILAIATVLFVSCGSLNFPTERAEYDFYNDNYNYVQIHMIYMNSPRWFYDNYYLDMYGRTIYYHRHPYYLRYQRESRRRVRNHNQVVLPTVGHTRVNSSRNIKRTNHSTQTRRTVTNNNRTTSTNRNRTRATITPNNKTRTITPTRTRTRTIAPTRTVRRSNTQTSRQQSYQAIKRSAPTRTQSSSRRK